MTKHTCDPSERAFGRRAPGCDRCAELAAGAAPRQGWQTAHFAQKARHAAIDAGARAAHGRTCAPCRTGIGVCTAFDW